MNKWESAFYYYSSRISTRKVPCSKAQTKEEKQLCSSKYFEVNTSKNRR